MFGRVVDKFDLNLEPAWYAEVCLSVRGTGCGIVVRDADGEYLWDSRDCYDKPDALRRMTNWLTRVVRVRPRAVADGHCEHCPADAAGECNVCGRNSLPGIVGAGGPAA